MEEYFGYDYSGPGFELFGPGHLLALALVAGVVAFLVWGWRDPTETAKRRARWLIIASIVIVEVAWHAWNIAHGSWTIRYHLPLHLCSLSIIGSIYVLMTRHYRVYEIIFFIGIAGAGQTLLTPEAGIYGLPHFRAVQTLAAHGLIVIALVYVTAIEGLRPTWGSIWKTMLFANVYMAFVTVINYLIGSNYMYTLRKPDSASLLDLMGPWPWYLFVAEFIALAMFAMIYLPFAIADRRATERTIQLP